MKFSPHTVSFISNISDYLQKPLKNTYEVSVLIDKMISEKYQDKFSSLIFTAKYINGLKSVLSNQIINRNDFMEKMFVEFNNNIQSFTTNLREYIDTSDIKIKNHFDNKYFGLDHTCLMNIMELTEDLSQCKEYFNRHPESLAGIHELGKTSL